jgi:hypothetical protein
MKVDLGLSKLKGRKRYMLLILAARLEESNSDTRLEAAILSDIKVHFLSLKEEFSRYFQI